MTSTPDIAPVQDNTQEQATAGRVTITQTTPEQMALTTREKISLSKTKITKEHLISEAVKYINEILTAPKEEKRVPSIVGFCLVAGVSRSRLYELTQTMPEVADIVEYIGMMQEELALSGGMTNRTNPIFSMFLLKSKHNYHDSPPQLTQHNNFNISPDLLSDALALIKAKKSPKSAQQIEA